jgi:hypothetical protein
MNSRKFRFTILHKSPRRRARIASKGGPTPIRVFMLIHGCMDMQRLECPPCVRVHQTGRRLLCLIGGLKHAL